LVCTWGRFYYYNRNCSFFKQVPDIGAYIGLLLIVSGVVVLNLFSKMDVH
jgi:multidrug transporter EmrE-like cation transporter